MKVEKRYSSGFTFQTSYVFSKLFTDSDTYWVTDNPRAADQYNRGLEKSIGFYDITHNFKLGLVYDLPFGKGRERLNHGIAVRSWQLARQRDSILCQWSPDRDHLRHRFAGFTKRWNASGGDDHHLRRLAWSGIERRLRSESGRDERRRSLLPASFFLPGAADRSRR